jgi:ketosteroid isomerase-like protein
MSQANVELVRRAFEAANAGGVEAALAFYPPDVVFYPIATWAEDAEYRGYDGVRELNAIFTNAFEDFAWDVHEVRGAGERVLVLTDMTGRIKGSAASIRERYAIVCSDFRDDTFGEVRFFKTWQQALEEIHSRVARSSDDAGDTG